VAVCCDARFKPEKADRSSRTPSLAQSGVKECPLPGARTGPSAPRIAAASSISLSGARICRGLQLTLFDSSTTLPRRIFMPGKTRPSFGSLNQGRSFKMARSRSKRARIDARWNWTTAEKRRLPAETRIVGIQGGGGQFAFDSRRQARRIQFLSGQTDNAPYTSWMLAIVNRPLPTKPHSWLVFPRPTLHLSVMLKRQARELAGPMLLAPSCAPKGQNWKSHHLHSELGGPGSNRFLSVSY